MRARGTRRARESARAAFVRAPAPRRRRPPARCRARAAAGRARRAGPARPRRRRRRLPRVTTPLQAVTDRDRERAEEGAGERAEEDGRHGLGSCGGRAGDAHGEDHLRATWSASADEEIELRVDQILLEDATGTMACLQFERLGLDRVAVPLRLVRRPQRPPVRQQEPGGPRYLRSFAARYGALYSRPGNGIAHYLHLERFARPGQVLLGADSHTTMAGALGMLAIGAGATEVAVAMAGRPYPVERPLRRRRRAARAAAAVGAVEGRRARAAAAARRARRPRPHLRVPRRRRRDASARPTAGRSATWSWRPARPPGSSRATSRRARWLAAQGREDECVELARRRRRRGTTSTRQIDLAELEPLIALPSSPGNVVPVREAAGTRDAAGLRRQLGQLVVRGPRRRRGRAARPVAAAELDLTVTPGSRQILDMIVRSGVYADLLAAGARILEPACGPCIGMGQAPAAGAVSVRTFNRNFPGRSGTRRRPRLPLLARDRGGDGAARRDRRPARARRAARR